MQEGPAASDTPNTRKNKGENWRRRKKVGWTDKVEIKQVEILAVGKACMARLCPTDTEFERTFNSSGFSTEGTSIHYITSESQIHYHVMHTII